MKNATLATNNRGGFGLTEIVMAMLIGTVAVLGLGTVMAASARVQLVSAGKLEMTALADSKMDELRMYASSRSADTLYLALGGSVTSDVTSFNETVTSVRNRSYKRRWLIANGLNGTRAVTVRVLPTTQQRYEIAYVEVHSLFLIDP